ncbi:hypothetical protein EYF80_061866 [Liparis tanakae]|uniref:Uncharacterized protein n=1 Tax=Liparis tanakae TaxID=230148 RepID=A0A4Z2EGI9_9TELE|nr:hypothetical protein EYF80_061866 [Liparis tanakae]
MLLKELVEDFFALPSSRVQSARVELPHLSTAGRFGHDFIVNPLRDDSFVQESVQNRSHVGHSVDQLDSMLVHKAFP